MQGIGVLRTAAEGPYATFFHKGRRDGTATAAANFAGSLIQFH